MKKILKFIFGLLLYLLIPGIFASLGALAYFRLIGPQIEAKNILKNGVEVTAAVIDFESDITTTSSFSIGTIFVSNDEDYYYIRLFFTNSEGKEIEYKTGSIYPEDFIRTYIERGGSVQVMSLGTKAVVKGFTPGYKIWLWIFPLLLGAVALVFIIILIVSLPSAANGLIIRKLGAPVTGEYLDKKKWFNNNNLDLNSIICKIKKDDGTIIEVQTPFLYTDADAEEFANLGTLPLVYKGNKAVIMIEKETS